MIYGLLGELEIQRDGRFLKLPSGHHLVVLAALLINANRRMSKADLLRAAWGKSDVGEAQLHKSAAALRALLGRIGCENDLLTHSGYGYEIRVSDDDLDMLLFRRLVHLAAQADAERRLDDETDHRRQALRLWRGPHPLSNVPGATFQQEITRLEQQRKRAAVRLFDLELARGGYDRILDDLQLIAGYYPADRRLCEQLMIAQYRCGHATDAITTYRHHAAALTDETGGLPDRPVRELHYAIGSGDEEALTAAESAIVRRAGTLRRAVVTLAVPRQLPPDPADFIGRDDLVAEASWLLGRNPSGKVPVVVISGAAGIGKTALGLRVSHLSSEHYQDGQLYIELHGTADQPIDTGEVLAQFLRALGVPAVPETLPERVSVYRTLLADRRVLVVLDDAADEAQIRDLVPANPGCGVLITARRKLPEIDGAHHVPPLPPLDRAVAMELFLRVVGNSGIDLRKELNAVDRVVTLCGGLPLALRIAGALRVYDHPRPTAELADRLARQGPEAFSYAGHSVARAIGAGFDRLGYDARQLFLGLGMLQLRSFGLWTAAALLQQTGMDPASALSELAASNILELVESEVRYRFHDLTRDYASRRARTEYANDSDHDAMPAQAYLALLSLTRRAHTGLYGSEFDVVHSAVPDWDAPPAVLAEVDESPLNWFEKERLNIRVAVGHCGELGLTDICWDLAVSAHEFYTVGGYFDDWYATHTVALGACKEAKNIRGEGIVLACLGQPALAASRPASEVSGPAELERAVGLLTECHDQHGQAIALRTLANALRRRGHLTRPLRLFNDALARYEADGDTVGRWQTLRYIGQTYLDLGDHDRALSILREAESIASEIGKQRLVAQTRYWIGQTCLATDDPEGAEAAFTEVLAAYGEPTSIGHAYAVHGLGDVARLTGALEEAERYFALAADLARHGADAVLEGRVCLSAAALDAVLEQQDRQVKALEDAVECFATCGAAYFEAQALSALSRAQADRGDDAASRAAWARTEDLYIAMALPAEDRIHRRPT